MQTISQIVKETISDVMLHNLRGQITSTSKLSALGMNSMDKVTLAMELERKLKITIPQAAAKKWQSVQSVTQYVRNAKLRSSTNRVKRMTDTRQKSKKTSNGFFAYLRSIFR